ncbi:putative tRNA adenosine deaminase-associated protein [Streptomyces ambofaciens]
MLIEQEDAWFGVVRVDGEEDPRIYVSDAAAASRSSYGEILLTDELLGREPGEDGDDLDALDLDGTEDGESDDDDEEDGGDGDGAAAAAGSGEAVPHGPVGDAEVLDDLGVSEKELRSMSGDAVGEIAEALGASDVLETVR